MNVKKKKETHNTIKYWEGCFNGRRGLFSTWKGREAEEKLLKFLAKLHD